MLKFKPHRKEVKIMANITRTFKATTCKATVYNRETKELETKTGIVSGVVDESKIAKELSRNGEFKDCTIVDISDISTIESLYGMTEQEFISKAKAFDERGKENRGMVSKVVKTTVNTVLCYDTVSKQLVKTTVTGKKIEKNLPDNYKFVDLVSSEEIEQLYCMDITTFIENARPMTDHFHFAD